MPKFISVGCIFLITVSVAFAPGPGGGHGHSSHHIDHTPERESQYREKEVDKRNERHIGRRVLKFTRTVAKNLDYTNLFGQLVAEISLYNFCIKDNNTCETSCPIPPNLLRNCNEWNDGSLECWCNTTLILTNSAGGEVMRLSGSSILAVAIPVLICLAIKEFM